MSRLLTRTAQTLIDLAILSIAYWAAFFLRFDGWPPFQMLKRLMFTWPYVVSFQYFVLAAFSVPRFAWRYVGLREATRTARDDTIARNIAVVEEDFSICIETHKNYASGGYTPGPLSPRHEQGVKWFQDKVKAVLG